jgi:hypothetical protein
MTTSNNVMTSSTKFLERVFKDYFHQQFNTESIIISDTQNTKAFEMRILFAVTYRWRA